PVSYRSASGVSPLSLHDALPISRIRLLGAGDHPEDRRLAGAVGPDDADDRARRNGEAQVVDEQPVAIALAHAVELDHRAAEPLGDRKSTRLNSSHVKISYAVFYL